ncbi:DinB family protein [Bacillus sp. JJ1521]|uniref:DinB family protein n=1 Tax=Bacillus sp. JJ1521 TaxID=3122957 RepID=UPI002FFE7B6E
MSNLINDNLDETRNNLIMEITSLNDIQFNESPGLNKWSIAQVCHHLILVEQATIKAIEWGLKEKDAKQERKNIHLLLDRTKKLNHPKIVDPGVDPFEIQTIIDSLNDSRNKLWTFLHTIEDKSILAEKSIKHPAFGELPLDQWIEQIYLHELRHIEQIKEIKLLIT